jgi:hypothetical protein
MEYPASHVFIKSHVPEDLQTWGCGKEDFKQFATFSLGLFPSSIEGLQRLN